MQLKTGDLALTVRQTLDVFLLPVRDPAAEVPYHSPDGKWDTPDEIPDEKRKAYYGAPSRPKRISTPGTPCCGHVQNSHRVTPKVLAEQAHFGFNSSIDLGFSSNCSRIYLS